MSDAPRNRMNGQEFGDSEERWYALRVRSRYENLVATAAANKGFMEFLPTYRTLRRWSDRTKTVERPLFPGYVFCRLDPKRRLPLLTIPGVLHFIGIGKTPLPIENTEINAIHRLVQAGIVMAPWPFVEAGERVRLETGPLAGVEGTLFGTSTCNRFVVSVSLLRRSVAVTIDPDWTARLHAKGAGAPAPFCA